MHTTSPNKQQEVEVIAAQNGSSEEIGEAILNRVAQLRAVLLAIAPHERTASERVLKGSVTDFVVK